VKQSNYKSGRVLFLSAAHFLHDMYSSFLSPVLPVLIEKHGLSLKMAGVLTPAFRSPSLIQPFIAYTADRGRVQWIFPLTILFTSLLMSLLVVVPRYSYVVALCFFAGTSAAFFHAIAVSEMGIASGNKVGTGMSLFMTGGELARSLGPLYIVTMLQLLPQYLLPLGAFPAVAIALFTAFTVSEHKKRRSSYPQHALPFGKVIKKGGRGLLLLIVIGVIQTFTLYGFSLFLPTFMKISGWSLFVSGTSLSALEISGAAGALIGGTISDRIGKRRFFILAGILLTIFMNLFLQSNTLTLRFAFLLVTGIFMFSPTPVRYAFAQELVPEFKGTASSVLMAFGFITSTVTSFVTGHLGDTMGLLRAFRILSFIPLLIIPFTLFLPEVSRAGSEEEENLFLDE
jgi:FSR family fosmidomycin resistance protein-like MFS transporter